MIALGMIDSMTEAVAEHAAVGQPGQTVEVGQLVECLLGIFEIGNIEINRNVVGFAAFVVIQRTDSGQLRINIAVFLATP